MKFLVLAFFAIFVAHSARANDSASISTLQQFGFSHFACQLRLSVHAGDTFTAVKVLDFYAADDKTALAMCLAEIGASVEGMGDRQRLIARKIQTNPIFVQEIKLIQISAF